MPPKKSFFDRLTGSVKMDPSFDDDQSVASVNYHESDIATDNEKAVREEATLPRASAQKNPQKKQIVEEAAPEEAAHEPVVAVHEETWEGQTEGQLTIDVYQTENEIVIKSTIAGVKPEDLDISITNDMVTIKGKRYRDESTRDEDYFYQECYWGAFSRSVILPVDIAADQAVATMKNGVLTLRLPKSEKMRSKKIAVKEE